MGLHALEERGEQCPYCGEPFLLQIDTSAVPYTCVEDCQVCCQPVVIEAGWTEAGDLDIALRRENE